MKNLKTISLSLVLVMILSLMFSITSFASTPVTVTVNGNTVAFPDAQPYIDENGRTMVPIRFVSEALGAEVSWFAEDESVTIMKNDLTITLYIGSHWISKSDGKNFEMDTVPVIINDRTFVPLRFVSECLNCSVEWVNDTRTVIIEEPTLYLTEEDFESYNDKTDLDNTPTKEVILYEGLDITIEEGDTHSKDEKGYLVINKYSGVTLKYKEGYSFNTTETEKPYYIIFDRNKDLKTQLIDMSDDKLFYLMTELPKTRNEIQLKASLSWKTGVGEKTFNNDIWASQFNIKEGENNTIVFEGWVLN